MRIKPTSHHFISQLRVRAFVPMCPSNTRRWNKECFASCHQWQCDVFSLQILNISVHILLF